MSKLRLPQPGTGHTFGVAMRLDGTSIWRNAGGDPNLMSGTAGPDEGGPGLRTDHPFIPWHRMQTALQHVEGHTAALMRRPGAPSHVTLVVTQEPCEDWPNGCDRILDAIIPLGSQLDVYVVDSPGSEPRYWDTYHGNGEGAAR